VVDRKSIEAPAIIRWEHAVSYGSLTLCKQYWVTYAFLTVIESAINAVYWFPFYYVFKFVLVLWMALPQTGYILSQRFPRPRSSKLTT